MIVQEYDLWDSVCKYCQASDIEINDEDHVNNFLIPHKGDEAIVYTTKGNFWCRSFEGQDGIIYMDVEILPN